MEMWVTNTVKPLNKGHIGDGPFVPCREVVLFLEVFSARGYVAGYLIHYANIVPPYRIH